MLTSCSKWIWILSLSAVDFYENSTGIYSLVEEIYSIQTARVRASSVSKLDTVTPTVSEPM